MNIADFRRSKLQFALAIMGAGMAVTVLGCAFERLVLGRGYPENTFLFNPASAFTDFSDVTLFAARPNPYVDPLAVYLPFTWVCFRPLHALPLAVGLIGCLFVCLGGLFLLLSQAIEAIVPNPIRRVACALVSLAMAYPVLLVVDRGNIEAVLVLLIAGAVFFLTRAQYGRACLCLVPAICFKLYPAVFLVFFVRQRKWAVTAAGIAASVVLTLWSLHQLALPLDAAWLDYRRDLAFFTRAYFYENYPLEGGASPWNAYKVLLISAAKVGLMSPVDFSFDNDFIRMSYALYSAAMLLLGLLVVAYLCLLEKEWLRGAIGLLLFLSVSAPSGGDYRLLYAGIALVLLIVLRTKRAHDFLILVLLALTMVPKKEIFLIYAGRTETHYRDVSIQVVLNPLFILAALALVLYDLRPQLDWRWSALRLRRLARSLLPRLLKART